MCFLLLEGMRPPLKQEKNSTYKILQKVWEGMQCCIYSDIGVVVQVVLVGWAQLFSMILGVFYWTIPKFDNYLSLLYRYITFKWTNGKNLLKLMGGLVKTSCRIDKLANHGSSTSPSSNFKVLIEEYGHSASNNHFRIFKN